MGRPEDRDDVKLAPGDRLVEGLSNIGAEVGLPSHSAASSFATRYEFVGKDSKGWWSTQNSLTAPGIPKAENQRRLDAQKANGQKSVDGRPRDARGRLLEKVVDTLVPGDANIDSD